MSNLKQIDFSKPHLRNAIRTFTKYPIVTIIEYYANSLGTEYKNKWVGKIKGYKIESFPGILQIKLNRKNSTSN